MAAAGSKALDVAATMASRRAKYGISKVLMRYCRSSDASAGMREYIRHDIVPLAKQFPEVQFDVKQAGQTRALVQAIYANGLVRQHPMDNLSAMEVSHRMRFVMGRRGYTYTRKGSEEARRKARIGVRLPVTESVQGPWDPSTDFSAMGLRV